jgi:hypothetical protein
LPYSLPGVGQAVAIGTNYADNVRPAGASSYDWAYANFNGYGAGAVVTDYSSRGAYVIASAGAHGAPGNVDALIFDFADATWKRQANAAGVAFIPNGDISISQTTGTPWIEINGAPAGFPAPSHTYRTCVYIPAALGGGPKGSYLKMGQWAATTSGAKGGGIHKLDLATGVWSRVTSGLATDDYVNTATVDIAGKKVWFVPNLVHRNSATQYLDLTDNTLKSTVRYGQPATYDSPSSYPTCFIYEPANLLIQYYPGYPLRALQLGNLAAGWTALNATGTPASSYNSLIYYPSTGKFYTRGNNTGNTLNRLSPPASNPLTGTWAWDTVTIGGASMPNFTSTGSNDGRQHTGTFFYVPGIDCLAWISGESTKVIVMKPPA